MKTLILSFVCLIGLSNATTAQTYTTKNASITFFSKTTMEDIKGTNNQVMSVLRGDGKIQFSMAIKGFHFEKALMEEHFNENYLEAEKFPTAKFNGNITNITAVNFKKDGVYNVTVSGDMTIHGVTKPATANGTLTIKDGKLSANSKFIVKLADYNVTVPSLVKDVVKQNQEVTVSCNYDLKP